MNHIGIQGVNENMNGVSRDTFKEYNTDAKLDTLFDYIQNIHNNQKEQLEKCGDRFGKLEKQKVVNTAIAGTSGFVGGFAAILAKMGLK